MAWTTPKDWTTGELVSAALLNTHLRDNLTFLHQPPGARVYNSANISIADSTWQSLTFNSERWDNNNIHDTASSTSRLTCKTDGVYLITGTVAFPANATGVRILRILINGSATLVYEILPTTLASVTMHLVAEGVALLTVNEYVELQVYQSSGAALNVTATPQYSAEFTMQRIG